MNNVTLLGRLTKDPELKFAANGGMAIVKFTLAVGRRTKKDETDFIRCVAFGKTAETICNHFNKGQQICLSGHIQTSSYNSQDGSKKYTTDVIIDTFTFCGNKSSSQNFGNNGGNDNNRDNGLWQDDDMTPVDEEDLPF